MKKLLKSSVLVFGLAAVLITASAEGMSQLTPNSSELEIDFRYAPRNWQTAICLPDDWQKTLVSKDGSLLYDYPGHGLDCDTTISLGVAGQSWVRQELVSPRIPIVRTTFRSDRLDILQEAFAVAPPVDDSRRAPEAMIERVGSDARVSDWAKPPPGTDPAFANIALGRGEPIRYRFRSKSGEYTVGFGLCEGYYQKPGVRVLDLKIEGKVSRTVDMVAERGQNQPAVYTFPARDLDGDGAITLEVAAAAKSGDKNTILNTLWVFAGTNVPSEAALISGATQLKPLVHLNCSESWFLNKPRRHDLLTMRLHNTSPEPVAVSPVLTIRSEFPVKAEVSRYEAFIGGASKLLLPEPVERVERSGKTTLLHFGKRSVQGKEELSFNCAVARGLAAGARSKLELKKAAKLRSRAEDYWKKPNLPYDHLTVPDSGIQALLDSSIRNIYQAREIKNGLPAFQVGPTCYRGLWVVDGSFLLEAVTFLGREAETRSGIQYLLSFQQPDGSFMLLDGHYKETGIVLWAVARHAQLTGDKAWLKSVWPRVERGFDYIRHMRTLPPLDAPNARLVPAGFSDGGLAGKVPEYTNVQWTLAGLRAAIEAALWLGLDVQAADWKKEYDDFLAVFRAAAERDLQTDSHGNKYLPVRMVSPEPVSPQKGQWAFLHAIFPGKLFPANDPLVKGNMAMLQAVECEGLIRDTGWVKDGLWNYFGSFYAHAWLWLGTGQKAADSLYAFGNHASPLLVWREEQMPVGEGEKVVGDMPHNWASAEFIRLVRHSLVLERGNELHLFEAMPRGWVKPGALTRVKDIATEFGPVSLECQVASDGKSARVNLTPPRRTPPQKILLHLDGWSGKSGVMELSPARKASVRVPLS